jgi:hypothetical protein
MVGLCEYVTNLQSHKSSEFVKQPFNYKQSD